MSTLMAGSRLSAAAVHASSPDRRRRYCRCRRSCPRRQRRTCGRRPPGGDRRALDRADRRRRSIRQACRSCGAGDRPRCIECGSRGATRPATREGSLSSGCRRHRGRHPRRTMQLHTSRVTSHRHRWRRCAALARVGVGPRELSTRARSHASPPISRAAKGEGWLPAGDRAAAKPPLVTASEAPSWSARGRRRSSPASAIVKRRREQELRHRFAVYMHRDEPGDDRPRRTPRRRAKTIPSVLCGSEANTQARTEMPIRSELMQSQSIVRAVASGDRLAPGRRASARRLVRDDMDRRQERVREDGRDNRGCAGDERQSRGTLPGRIPRTAKGCQAPWSDHRRRDAKRHERCNERVSGHDGGTIAAVQKRSG